MWRFCLTLILILLVKDSYQQEDDVNIQDIANAILKLENNLGEKIENHLKVNLEHVLNEKIMYLEDRFNNLDRRLLDVQQTLDLVRENTQSIDRKMIKNEERSQIRHEETLSNLKNMKEELLEESKKWKIQENSPKEHLTTEQNNSSGVFQNNIDVENAKEEDDDNEEDLEEKSFDEFFDEDEDSFFEFGSLEELEETVEYGVGCPISEGFFVTPAGCFKGFNDERRSWSEADAKCKSEGLALARIYDHDAVAFRKYVVENQFGQKGLMNFKVCTTGCHSAWIGARGNGVAMRWTHDQALLSSDSDLWWPYDGRRLPSSDHCLALLVTNNDMKRNPGSTYESYPCSPYRLFTLCELISKRS